MLAALSYQIISMHLLIKVVLPDPRKPVMRSIFTIYVLSFSEIIICDFHLFPSHGL